MGRYATLIHRKHEGHTHRIHSAGLVLRHMLEIHYSLLAETVKALVYEVRV